MRRYSDVFNPVRQWDSWCLQTVQMKEDQDSGKLGQDENILREKSESTTFVSMVSRTVTR